MKRNALVQILADGQLHSGQAISEALGVSRTAVWKQFSRLEEFGLHVDRQRGQGYRLDRPLDLLNVDQLLDGLSEPARNQVQLDICDSVTSTNDQVLAMAPGPEKYSVCFAEQQTAGRGRRGRGWQSPFARNLSFSLVFDSERGVSGLDGLSLAVGVSVARTLDGLGIQGVGIKWPNDLWWQDRKLAGILVELSGELQTRCRVVIGIGLNFYMDESEAAVIDQPCTSLALMGAVPEGGRNRLSARVLDDLVLNLDQFEQDGFRSFAGSWDAFDVLKGREVSVVGQALSGTGAGIDPRGAYRLETSSGVVELNAGEVSVRPGEAS